MSSSTSGPPIRNDTQSASVRIVLLAGSDARSWLTDDANLELWRSLHARCAWGTTFQSADYFCVWLRNYVESWSPLLVLGLDDRSGLVGLFPLVVKERVITGGGAHQAEYHGWLADSHCPGEFFKDAVAGVLKEFPDHELRLRYLPPGAPKDAVAALVSGDRRAFAQSEDRPLLGLDEADINETLKKKGNRSKINRLKRLGAYSVRKMEADEFERRIDEIAVMCDFRQGAVNDSCPFTDDVLKRPFHLDWVRSMPHEVHVNGMFIGDELISVLIFALSKGEAHIAITAHSPAHSDNSPGKIHIYEAALALGREGYSLVDMTPGGDEWKSRFATTTDKVVELTVFASARKAALVRLRRVVGSNLRSVIARGQAVYASLRARPARATDDAKQGAGEFATYSPNLDGRAINAAAGDDVRVNALADLLKHGPAATGQNRQTFLSRALTRMEAGDRCYSLLGHNGLDGLCWSGGDKTIVRLSDFSISAGVDVRRAYAALVQRAASDLAAEARVSLPLNPVLQSVVEGLGFQRIPD